MAKTAAIIKKREIIIMTSRFFVASFISG